MTTAAHQLPTTTPTIPLEQSRAYCEQLTRTYARNFYYGLRLLPSQKRASMYALYAWMRLVDDIADHEDGRTLPQRIEELEAWRTDTHSALANGPLALDGETKRLHSHQRFGRQLWPAF